MSQADTHTTLLKRCCMQSRKCNQCGEVKSLDDFTRANPSNSFKNVHRTHHSYCRPCNALRAKVWRTARPGYRGSGKLKSTPPEDRVLVSAIRQRLVDARSRCKKLGKEPPQVSADYLYQLYLKQERSCALTGSLLVLEKEHPLCLSLDQVDPSRGYIEGNVQWLAWCVNRAKGDLSMDHFYEMCEVILDHRKVQRLSNGSAS